MFAVRPLCLFAIALLFALGVQAQFFTKSSKSIPRMGRRSDESFRPSLLARRALIDSLVDEFGPSNLLSALEARANSNNAEVAVTNEQPMDFNPSVQIIEAVDLNAPLPVQYEPGRDERSPYLFRRAGESAGSGSLAMRALNTERYLRHLASGQPLLPLNRLVSGSQAKEGGLLSQRELQRSSSDRRRK